MRRGLRLLLSLAAIVLAIAPAARAATISDTDIFNPDDKLFNRTGADPCTSINGSGDDSSTDSINDGGAGSCLSLTFLLSVSGFTQPPDSLTSAWLYLTLDDDGDNGPGNPEAVKISLNGNVLNNPPGEYDIEDVPPSISVKLIITTDGKLDVLLTLGDHGEGQADFLFQEAKLEATWEELGDGGTNTAPEPATMLLLGGGLAAAGYRRFKSRAQVQ